MNWEKLQIEQFGVKLANGLKQTHFLSLILPNQWIYSQKLESLRCL